MMKSYIQTLVLALTLLLFTACGGGSSGNTTQDTAINKLEAYANSNGTTTVPTLQDYLDAGVTGIDSDTQLSEINQVLEGLVAEDVDTTAEVQALADDLGVEVPEETVAPTPVSTTPTSTTPSVPDTPTPTTPPVVVTPDTPTPTIPPVVVTPDTTAPVISIIGANPATVIQGDVYSDEAATATDDVDGPVPLMSTVVVDINILGSYAATYTATDAAGNTATAIRTVNVVAASITHNGTTYGTVTSPYTGRIWLDRNLGAAQVCTSFDDVACYGDYYQWGRNFDGHQDSTSAITLTQATNVNSAGSSFIASNSTPPRDWVVDVFGPLRSANWSKTDGTSVCPLGFRTPTFSELQTETLDNGVTDSPTAFSNFLRLPSAGYRNNFGTGLGGVIDAAGEYGFVWANNTDRPFSDVFPSIRFAIIANQATTVITTPVEGKSVRCIKD